MFRIRAKGDEGMIFGDLRKKWKAWNHRQEIKCAVDTAKHWKFESRWLASSCPIGLVFAVFSLLFLSTHTIGSIAVHLIFASIFAWMGFEGINPKKYPRCLAYMTQKERVYRIARFYKVDPDEVFTALRKGR